MRRGRGKGKKQNAREDRGSGEEEKFLAYRRRGRPQKSMKDDIEGEEEEILEKDNDTNGLVITTKEDVVTENGKKRKKPVESKESNITEEENVVGSKPSTDDSMKSPSLLSIGFRPNGSRRKNKPRRAAEAVVDCNGV
ncbi:unnamed protein product [Cochlearia groenlandica]